MLPQGQENQEKSGQTKKNVKGQENSVKNGSFWKKSGNLTTFEKISDFVCLNLENSLFPNTSNDKELTKNRHI